MADDDCVIVSGRDTGTELLAVCRLKVLFGRHKDIRTGIEPEKIAAPLLCQMVGNNIEALLRQSQALALHAGRDHLEGLACAHAMGKQRVVAVQDVRHSIFLMLHELYLRRHTHKTDMRAVILTRPDAVEKLVIGLAQILPSVYIPEDPFLEGFLDHFLLLLRQHGLLLIENAMFFSVHVLYGIVDFGVL